MGSNPTPSLPKQQNPVDAAQPYTPDLMAPYNKYMPSNFFGNAPVDDPTPILQAYEQNIPAFQQGTRSSSSPIPTAQQPTQQQAIMQAALKAMQAGKVGTQLPTFTRGQLTPS